MKKQTRWQLSANYHCFICFFLLVAGVFFASVSFSFASEKLDLTTEEQAFLASNPVINVGVARNWPPFEYFSSRHSELQGISHDYLSLLETLLNLKFVINDKLTWLETLILAEKGKIDLLPAIMDTPYRSYYLDFTQPYVRSPMIIVTNSQVSFIANINELDGMRVAVVKGYAPHEMLAQNHPLIDLDLKDSAIDALKAVASGEIYAFVDNLAVASYLIRTQGLANLKISGQTPYAFDLSMGINKNQPHLKSIIDKALLHVSRQQHNAIYDRWVSIDISKPFPWMQVLLPVSGLSLVLLILSFYTFYLFNLNKKIRQVNARLTLTELELTEKNAQLKCVSITDKLTGAYNRHYLDKALSKQLALAQNHNRPLSIALFDLDYFKKVNDNFGHQIGDAVLKFFTDLVKNNIRSTDVFGRWGGEEFLLIFPETNKQNACILADRIRQCLEVHLFEAGFKQTVSAGVVEVQANLTADQFLFLADKQLYLAKQTGRNKVMS